MKPGDTVKLKSGGPTMTVETKNSSGDWYCIYWNNAKNEFNGHAFAEALLVPVG